MTATILDCAPAATIRAIGISRVSDTGDRGERLRSFNTQRERMTLLCGEHDWQLVQVLEEPDVSGGSKLANRPGLLAAVEAIEAGLASILVVGFKDRLDRDPGVRDEVIDRVETVGGMVWTADAGRQTNADAVAQFTGTTLSAAGRMIRRQAGERSRAAVVDAVAEGVVPWNDQTPGYRRGPDRRLVVIKREAKVVRQGFALRAGGATIAEVREYLDAHGIVLSYRRTQVLLRSTIVLGRIDFGDLHNGDAHDAIVERDIWEAAQDMTIARGPRSGKSDRLLARLGVLRCQSCGGGMIASMQTQGGRRYPFYRCAKVAADCSGRAAISAVAIEQEVVGKVLEEVGERVGRASMTSEARAADAAAAAAQDRLDQAIGTFTAAGLLAEPSAAVELAQLREARDAAQTRVRHLRETADSEETLVRAAEDWSGLTLAEQRAVVALTIDRAVVRPGRGGKRVDIVTRKA